MNHTLLEQAARNVINVGRWQREVGPYLFVAPFPWAVKTDRGIVSIVAANDAVLIEDKSRDADPALWAALVSALNTLAEVLA